MKSKFVKQKIHVKVGDTVKVISGKDKGKIGKINQILAKKNTVIVEGVNFKTKHQKSRQEGEAGSIVKKEAPIHSSNVMYYSEKDDIVSRIGAKEIAEGSKTRYLVKNQEVIK
uniref:ribosomal protein L24 n=1 Tax=Stylonema alsidii TaxID=35155 RepID=UPI001FCDEF9C|nr:ribosomal protein L24 [Stylonema alsidii]UNJ15165.1 ribosomal protein L24 [Stylonema alsidii]